MIEVINVEQGTVEWHNERFGHVTGTRLQSAIGAKMIKGEWFLGNKKIQDTLMSELISERMSQNEIDDFKSKDMQRGNDLEPMAIAATSSFNAIEYDPCGMLFNPEIPWFKFSPDGVFFEGGIIIGGIETKCPSGKKHIQYMLADEIPQEYFWQVAAPFIMSDQIKFWDFTSFDDRNYERELFTIRVKRKELEQYIEPAREELKEFLKRVDEVHTGLTF